MTTLVDPKLSWFERNEKKIYLYGGLALVIAMIAIAAAIEMFGDFGPLPAS